MPTYKEYLKQLDHVHNSAEAQIQNRINNLENEGKGLKGYISELEGKRNTLEINLKNIQEKEQQLEKNKRNLEDENNRKQDHINWLEENKRNLEDENNRKQDHINWLEENKRNLEDENNNKQNHINWLEENKRNLEINGILRLLNYTKDEKEIVKTSSIVSLVILLMIIGSYLIYTYNILGSAWWTYVILFLISCIISAFIIAIPFNDDPLLPKSIKKVDDKYYIKDKFR